MKTKTTVLALVSVTLGVFTLIVQRHNAPPSDLRDAVADSALATLRGETDKNVSTIGIPGIPAKSPVPADVSVALPGIPQAAAAKAAARDAGGYTTCAIQGGKAVGTVHNTSGSASFSGSVHFNFFNSDNERVGESDTTGVFVLVGDDTSSTDTNRVPGGAAYCTFDVSRLSAGYPIQLVPLPSQHISGSGSMSKTCSGNLKVCNGNNCSSFTSQYYYIYAYQYASVTGGKIGSESHSFSLSGALAQSGSPALVGAAGNWIVYKGEKFTLRIPWNSRESIYAQQNLPDAPLQLLCK